MILVVLCFTNEILVAVHFLCLGRVLE